MRKRLASLLCPFLLCTACASTPRPVLCPKPQPPPAEAMVPPNYQRQLDQVLNPPPLILDPK